MMAASRRSVYGPSLFAAIGLAAAVAGAIGTIVVRLITPAPFITVAFGYGGLAMVGFLIAGLTWASIGALLVIRRPGNAVGWLMVPVGVGNTLSQLTAAMTFAFVAQGTAEGERLAQFAGWATVLLQLVGIFQIAIGFVFPSGRTQSRRWAWFMGMYWAMAIVFLVISLSQPGPLQLVPTLQNPFGFGPDLRGDRPIAPILAIPTLIVLAGLGISMVSRYRSAARVERQQLKWFVLALGLSTIALGILFIDAVILNRPADTIGLTVYVFAGAVVPVAIGIAILRHHLYDIDRVVSRTISYACVSIILGAIFLAGVFGGQTALAGVLGDNSSLVVAGSTLVTFALFQPVRRHLQALVDRRFNRARYDADQVMAAFADRIRAEVDLDAITVGLGDVVRHTTAPRIVGVWLRADRG